MTNIKNFLRQLLAAMRQAATAIRHVLRNYWRQNLGHKVLVVTLLVLSLWVAGMYGVARWYMWTKQDTPLVMGTSFIPAYAESLGLEPKETMDALIHDLDVRHFRLVSYWNQIETSPGVYDFSGLDWQFQKAEAAGAKVSLSLGLRQPRWPECHEPDWIDISQPENTWSPQLQEFIAATVKRYKDSPALSSYQLENEYFLKAFGECQNFSRQRLIDEYQLVKRLDPVHPVIISRSNNALGTPIREPTPDVYGVSVYKRTWNPYINRVLEYPFPAWFYASLAGTEKIIKGKDTIIHELQAEAWPPHGLSIRDATIEQQNLTFDADIFKHRIEYGKATGMKEIYLWSGEYWYYRKQVLNDPSVWKVAQEAFNNP